MTHEISITRRNKDGTWSNYASSPRSSNTRPLRTNGKFKFKSKMEAIEAAKARSRRSNFDRGNNTTYESSKEEKRRRKR